MWLAVVSDWGRHDRLAVKCIYWLSVLHVSPDLLSSLLLGLSKLHCLRCCAFLKIAGAEIAPGFIYWVGNSRRQEFIEAHKESLCRQWQSIVNYGWKMILGTSVTADCGANCGFAAVSIRTVPFNLVKSKEYTVWSYNINPIARKLNQLLPFYKLTTYGFTKPYAARCRLFSQISLLSFHCQSRLGFYDLNSDGCIPVWNDLAGCECGPSFASYSLPFGEREEKAQWPSEETWESLCVDDAPPLSNWGKANMIRHNLKDDQCLPPQRHFTVMRVLLRALLRGGPTQFDDTIKLLFQQKKETTTVPIRKNPWYPNKKMGCFSVCVFWSSAPMMKIWPSLDNWNVLNYAS